MAMDSLKRDYFLKKGKREGRMIISYLKVRLVFVFLYLFITAVFFAITALYGYGNAFWNMFYAVIIVAFFGAMYAVFDYQKYRKKCLVLFSALEKGEERAYFLPEGGDVKERIYQQMLKDVEQEKKKLRMAYDEKKKDMTDYYTMWIHQVKTPIAALRLLLLDEEENVRLIDGSDNCVKDRGQELEELFKIEEYAEMALTYARLESISSDLLFQYCDVRNVVKQALRKHFVLFSRSGLSLHLEEFTLKAVTDEKWLSFVVGQVLSNALKYTDQGGISIYGSDEEGKVREGKVHYLVVEDTGVGIRESDLPRVFERGFTGCNGRMEERSTGIGLYLCRQVMDGLSHTIRIKSQPGKGTKVILGFWQEEY